MRTSPARGASAVEVRRLSARAKAGGQARKDGRAARTAEMTLRWQPTALPCPGAEPIELFIVHAREEQPPPEVEPLEWFLLTTVPVADAADAERILHWYTLRRRIEEYFRSSSPAAKSRKCSTAGPSGSNGPWPSRWSSGGGFS